METRCSLNRVLLAAEGGGHREPDPPRRQRAVLGRRVLLRPVDPDEVRAAPARSCGSGPQREQQGAAPTSRPRPQHESQAEQVRRDVRGHAGRGPGRGVADHRGGPGPGRTPTGASRLAAAETELAAQRQAAMAERGHRPGRRPGRAHGRRRRHRRVAPPPRWCRRRSTRPRTGPIVEDYVNRAGGTQLSRLEDDEMNALHHC